MAPLELSAESLPPNLSPELRKLILKLPALEAPPGVKANFKNPDNIQVLCNGLLFFYVGAATILTAVKIYTQATVIRKLRVEDYGILLSWAVFVFAYAPVCWHINTLPIGAHQWDVTLGALFQHLHYFYIAIAIYMILCLILKIAICLQIIHIFVPAGIRGSVYWASHALIWIQACWTVVIFFCHIFSCSPRSAFWDKLIPHAKCMDFLAVLISGCVLVAFSDFLMLLIPQAVIYRLQLHWKRKLAISAIFAVGILACISAAFQLYESIHLYQHHTDYTYNIGLLSMWCNVQIICGFLVACLPSFPKFFLHVRGKEWYIGLVSALNVTLCCASGTREVQQIPDETPASEASGKREKRQITDIEFHQLVKNTNASSSFGLSTIESDIQDSLREKKKDTP